VLFVKYYCVQPDNLLMWHNLYFVLLFVVVVVVVVVVVLVVVDFVSAGSRYG